VPISRRAVVLAGGALAGGALAGGSLLSGCGRAVAARASEAGPAGLLRVFTWWASAGPEQNGLLALLADFKGRAPDVTFQAVRRLVPGDPPDCLQARPGYGLAARAASGLEPLDGLFAREGWADRMPAGLLPLLRTGGSYTAVPAGVHRANVLWSVPAASAAAAPGSTAEWLAALRRLDRAGLVPLVLGGRVGVRHALETVLLAELGPTVWAGLWRPGGDWGGPGVAAALRALRELLALALVAGDDVAHGTGTGGEAEPSAGAQAAAEAEAVRLFGTGQAGYLLAGDWVEPALRGWYGLRAGSGYRWAAAPGTAGLFQVRADVFAVPKAGRNRAAALSWLAECGSVDGQVALNGARGAIPVRTDLPEQSRALFGPYLRWSLDEWRDGRALDSPAHGEPVAPEWAAGIDAALAVFRTDGEVAKLQDDLAGLAARYAA